jgi:amidase
MRQQWRDLFKAFDVVLCPPMPTPAFPHDHAKDHRTRHLDIDGKQVPYTHQIPIGVQIIGPYLEDHTTIGFAGLIEREFGGFVEPPPISR